MIVVIADDLSGAAELASVACNAGLSAQVHTRFDPRAAADVIAIDTDTRCRPAGEAAEIVRGVTRAIVGVAPGWIYKKTDSVLRGNVRAEIEAILGETRQCRCLLAPANPSKNRVIRRGIYWIDEIPLAKTLFAADPMHPRRSSGVMELLGDGPHLIEIPDVASAADLSAHAARVDQDCLPAGGVDFFEAMLRATCDDLVDPASSPPNAICIAGARSLLICGSSAAWDNGRGLDCENCGIPALPMPAALFDGQQDEHALEEWITAICDAVRQHGRAMLAIGRRSTERSPLEPHALLRLVIDATIAVLERAKLDQLFIEGGATAAALLDRMSCTQLTAVPTLRGIAALAPQQGPLLVIKPGSYAWPKEIWHLRS